MSYLPCYFLGEPNVPGFSTFVNANTPVFSSYTGQLISYGPVKVGTISDAPIGNPNHNKPFHVIEIDSNGNHMMHSKNKVTR